MNKRSHIIADNAVFYILFSALFIISAFLLYAFSKGDSFLFLDGYHALGFNVFLVNYTFLGDGIFAMGLFIFLIYRKQATLALYLFIAFISAGICVQLIKNILHADSLQLYFEASQYRFLVDAFDYSGIGTNNFPSGHTASAFAIATVLALYYPKRIWQFGFLLAALLVGYSRIYLAYHFPIDILIGSLIGVVSGTTTIWSFQYYKSARIRSNPPSTNSAEKDFYSHSALA